MRRGIALAIGCVASLIVVDVHGQKPNARPPIIDVHLHAYGAAN